MNDTGLMLPAALALLCQAWVQMGSASVRAFLGREKAGRWRKGIPEKEWSPDPAIMLDLNPDPGHCSLLGLAPA